MPHATESATRRRGGFLVTPQQDHVVEHLLQNKVTVVSAGAGSGKTYTTVAGLMELLDTRKANLDQCVLITFTNKAADELRHRIERALLVRKNKASSGDRHFWNTQLERLGAAFLGTIHSFCSRIIRLYGYNHAVAREAEMTFANSLRTEAEKNALEQYIQNTPKQDSLFGSSPQDWREYEVRDLLDKIINYIQNQGIHPGQLVAWTERRNDEDGYKARRVAMAKLVKQAYLRYETDKHAENLLDAHDLLQRAADLLSSSLDEVGKRIQRRYRYLFIDEFQDTDLVQKQIVSSLIPYLKGVMVVGDSKQSIYAFRGADVTLLEQLAQENGVRVLPLNISRRPTVPFLETQNVLFRCMGQRFKELDAPLETPDGGHEPSAGPPPLIYISAGDKAKLQERIQTTARVIQERLLGRAIDLREQGHCPIQHGHIVLLLRSNYMVQQYADGLQRLGIPTGTEAGESFYTQPEIVATYRMLRLLLHYPDDAMLSMALATPYLREVKLSRRELDRIQYDMQGTPLFDDLENGYPKVHEHLEDLRRRVRTDTVSQIIGHLYELFGIQDFYRVRSNFRALRNLERLREKSRSLFDEEQALTLRQFVDWMQIAIQSDREEPNAELSSSESSVPDTVRVMTIHRAKGLEFPIVLIPEVQKNINQEESPHPFLATEELGLEVDFSPPRSGSTQPTFSPLFWQIWRQRQSLLIQEEMRIFYVAVTRAQHSVILIGSGRQRPDKIGSKSYAWLDEILQARESLCALPYGIIFDFGGDSSKRAAT